jgi:ERCC4-type nuclease
MDGALPPLPAIRKPPVAAVPTLVIDTREQAPLAFSRLPSVRATLQSGDYSYLGGEELFGVERKSIADLVACCMGDNRERFERELHRLRGFRFKRLLIVGTRADVEQHRYRSNLTPKAVFNTLSAFEVRYDLPVVWADEPNAAAFLVEEWAWWFARETLCAVNELIHAGEVTQS